MAPSRATRLDLEGLLWNLFILSDLPSHSMMSVLQCVFVNGLIRVPCTCHRARRRVPRPAVPLCQLWQGHYSEAQVCGVPGLRPVSGCAYACVMHLTIQIQSLKALYLRGGCACVLLNCIVLKGWVCVRVSELQCFSRGAQVGIHSRHHDYQVIVSWHRSGVRM